MIRAVVLSLLAALLLSSPFVLRTPALAEDRPFPAGESTQEIEGLNVTIVMPEAFDATAERSMIVILHGLGGTATGMARSLAYLAARDYVIVAPKAKGTGWEPDDIARVKRIVGDLKARCVVGETRLHGVGFSNGGWNLASVAFDEDLHFTSACWVAAGYSGGAPPKHAKKGMGVLAAAGSEDGNRPSAESTPGALADKVRSADCRIEQGIGHAWPRKIMDGYYGWWVGAQEGRFTPGATLAFEWDAAGDADASEPPSGADDGKSGAFVYWYSADDQESAEAKEFENEVMLDGAALFFGRQLRAVKRDCADHEDAFAALKLKTTPAIVVYDAKGKVKKTLSGKVKAKSLASALRGVAAVRKLDD